VTIELSELGAVIVGVPTLEDWSSAFTQALSMGASATWQRTDLITFAEDENPYDDEQFQAVKLARISEGTYNNDLRRGRRFPRGNALRRFMHECSVSHFDAVAPLGDVDAEIVLEQAAREDLGREWVRSEVKRIKNQPDPRRHVALLRVASDGSVALAEPPPTWAWGADYEVVLKERSAA